MKEHSAEEKSLFYFNFKRSLELSYYFCTHINFVYYALFNDQKF